MGRGGGVTGLTNKVFLLNDMRRKLPDIKITIKRERMVKVLVSVCKANKGERERKNRDLQQKLEEIYIYIYICFL
jgi:hypothetical protein